MSISQDFLCRYGLDCDLESKLARFFSLVGEAEGLKGKYVSSLGNIDARYKAVFDLCGYTTEYAALVSKKNKSGLEFKAIAKQITHVSEVVESHKKKLLEILNPWMQLLNVCTFGILFGVIYNDKISLYKREISYWSQKLGDEVQFAEKIIKKERNINKTAVEIGQKINAIKKLVTFSHIGLDQFEYEINCQKKLEEVLNV
ncbi:MAG: hypothetical protein S4CHLAM20_07590 [Chlamydiia bacterium]|nr:hypothetical protein [Chlamydiia bacterium]